jgi:hypothetical protein
MAETYMLVSVLLGFYSLQRESERVGIAFIYKFISFDREDKDPYSNASPASGEPFPFGSKIMIGSTVKRLSHEITLGLELTMHFLNSQIHLVRQSLKSLRIVVFYNYL